MDPLVVFKKNLSETGFDDVEGIRTEIERIDKSNSKVNSPRFNKKPGISERGKYYRLYPERDSLIRTALLHAALYVRCDDAIEPKSRPAYDRFFGSEYDGPEPQVLEANDAPDVELYRVPIQREDSDDDVPPLIRDIEKLASLHINNDEKLTEETDGVPVWLLPRYNIELEEKLGDGEISAPDRLDTFDLSDWRSSHSVSEDVRVEDGTADEVERPAPLTDADEQDLIDNGEGTEQTKRDTRQTQQQSPQETRNQKAYSHAPQQESDSVSAQDKLFREETGRTSADVSPDTGNDVPVSQLSGPALLLGDDQYEMSDEEVQELLDDLKLDENADPETVIKTLFEALDERNNLRDQLLELADLVNIERILGEPVAIAEQKD